MKKTLFLLLLGLIHVSFLNAQENAAVQRADSIVKIAKAQLGVTYKYGTSIPNVSFDCSGFTSYVYGFFHLPNPRSSSSYASVGEKVSIEEARKGDCILFTGTSKTSTSVGHVGIVTENSEGNLKFIHCSSSKKHFGVVETTYNDSNYPSRFLEVRRLF